MVVVINGKRKLSGNVHITTIVAGNYKNLKNGKKGKILRIIQKLEKKRKKRS